MIKYNLSAAKLTPATPSSPKLRVCVRVCVVYIRGVRRVKAICGELVGWLSGVVFVASGGRRSEHTPWPAAPRRQPGDS